MSNLPPPPPPPPPGRGTGGGRGPGGPTPQGQGQGPGQGRRTSPPGLPKWSIALLVVVVIGALAATQFWPSPSQEKLTWSEMLTQVENGAVKKLTIDTGNRSVTGEFTTASSLRALPIHRSPTATGRSSPRM